VAAINGEPALLTFRGAVLVATTSVVTDSARIQTFLRVLNPEKLRHLQGRPAIG